MKAIANFTVCGLSALIMGLPITLSSQSAVVTQASQLEADGLFLQARQALTQALTKAGTDQPLRQRLEFKLDRLNRIKADYSLSKQELLVRLRRYVHNVTDGEFALWISEGRFESRVIDGKRYFSQRGVSNLIWRYSEIAARSEYPFNYSQMQSAILFAVRQVRKSALISGKAFVSPKRFLVTVSVGMNADYDVPVGTAVRAWLPIPRMSSYQSNFRLRSSSPRAKAVSKDDAPLRSAFMELVVRKDRPSLFALRYEYTSYGVFFNPTPALVRAGIPDDPQLHQYLSENSHIQFTPRIKNLADSLTNADSNPLLKARKLYEWLTQNIRYGAPPDYNTIQNIGDYCASAGYGDCVMDALLYISLCRSIGIPARWQSGWITGPIGSTVHAWSEIYVSPLGWLPVDPYMGVLAMQYFSGDIGERREIRDFYFGGLDQYRMTANSDCYQELTPPKRSIRNDIVGLQIGELEYRNTNVNSNRFYYKLKATEVTE